MTVDQLIAAKKAERIANKLAFTMTFDNTPSFTYYAASRGDFEKKLAAAKRRVGVKDAAGSTCTGVTVL